MPARARARFRLTHIGVIFQTNNLIPVLTAAENVALPLSLSSLSARDRHRRVDGLMDELGVRAVARRRPAELSGGQQQRVGIARALVTNPQIVLADEPTAHLDIETGLEVMSLLRSLNTERGTTLIFSTHDPAMEAIAAQRFVLRGGRLLDEHVPTATLPWQTYSSSRSVTYSATLDGH